jgi:heat shock protein HslJ
MATHQGERYFFSGSGNDWDIKISEESISFHSDASEISRFSAPTPEPIRVADANIKNYVAYTEAGSIDVQITQGICQDSLMAYEVTVKIKRGIDSDYTEFNGCGDYILDYRLHDIWVLNSLKEKELTLENFREEFPRLEIDAKEKRFSGFGGCNQIHGQLFSEHKLLRFTNIAQTRMLCAPPNQENDFLSALRQSTHYQLKNNELILSNPDGETLRFKKVD